MCGSTHRRFPYRYTYKGIDGVWNLPPLLSGSGFWLLRPRRSVTSFKEIGPLLPHRQQPSSHLGELRFQANSYRKFPA